VARYYRADTGQNRAISTEITGYAASALVFLREATGDEGAFAAARRAADFLVRSGDAERGIFPFECVPDAEGRLYGYFFDSGIIVRGLLAVWRETQETELLELAVRAARNMARDYASGEGDWHPILRLPEKAPEARSARWSRESGCYQLKSALAWLDVAEATGDRKLAAPYYAWLKRSLATHRDYLPGAETAAETMDRLHPYCYFLEALAPFAGRADCRDEYAWGLERAGGLLREIRGEFLRADVCAQLLRARLLAADHVKPDVAAAREEAQELRAFQAQSDDPRTDGGFWFGRRGAELTPHVSPVPTAFAVQALELWEAFAAGKTATCQQPVI
jgi:hypothetical protein